MKFVILSALCLASWSSAHATDEKIEKLGTESATQITVEPPQLDAETDQALFDRVKSAHARAVQRGVVTL